jgi:hypothetical protein
MKRLTLIFASLLLFVSTIFFTACETDIDVSSEWKDITVVYGLINKSDSVHYLKISKAFLGDGNALEYAQIADSSSYYNNLEVTLTEKLAGSVVRVLPFDTVLITDKDDGVFYSPNQVVYSSNFIVPLDVDNKDYTYDLMVRNKTTGKEVTSSTSLVKNFDITTPRFGQPTIDFISPNAQPVKWKTAKDGRRYDVFIRIWFEEVISPNNDTIDRYFDWKLGSANATFLDGKEELNILYVPEAMYGIAQSLIPRRGVDENNISEEDVVARLINRAEYTVVVSGDALNTYLDVNEPSSGIIQDRPEYTNIDNGLGLFSSRFAKLTSIKIGAKTESRLIEISSLKFVDKLGN